MGWDGLWMGYPDTDYGGGAVRECSTSPVPSARRTVRRETSPIGSCSFITAGACTSHRRRRVPNVELQVREYSGLCDFCDAYLKISLHPPPLHSRYPHNMDVQNGAPAAPQIEPTAANGTFPAPDAAGETVAAIAQADAISAGSIHSPIYMSIASNTIADEIALYDRQIRLWGVQAQEK